MSGQISSRDQYERPGYNPGLSGRLSCMVRSTVVYREQGAGGVGDGPMLRTAAFRASGVNTPPPPAPDGDARARARDENAGSPPDAFLLNLRGTGTPPSSPRAPFSSGSGSGSGMPVAAGRIERAVSLAPAAEEPLEMLCPSSSLASPPSAVACSAILARRTLSGVSAPPSVAPPPPDQ